jgi:hypothetical protein
MRKSRKYLLAAVLASFTAFTALAFEGPYFSQGKTIAAAGTVELAFTPEDAADRMVISAINNANRQILVQAFSLPTR